MSIDETQVRSPSYGGIRPAPRAEKVDIDRYRDPEFARLEEQRLWRRVWQLACFDDEVAQPGDYYEYQLGPFSVLLVRDQDGRLRGYHNSCLHRGRELRSGTGNSPNIWCKYHGWTWNLDGSLKHVPDRETFAPIEDHDYALPQVRVEQWGRWVFINMDPDAEPLEQFLGPLLPLIEPYRFDRQFKWCNQTTIVRANWKNTVDAFLEGYHGRTVHPESIGFINYTDYEVELLGQHGVMRVRIGEPDGGSPEAHEMDYEELLDSMEWSLNAFQEDTSMVRMLREVHPEPGQNIRDLLLPQARPGYQRAGMDMSGLSDEQLVDDHHFTIFPNVIWNSFAFGAWIFRMRPMPGDPTSCYLDMWYTHRVPDDQELPNSVAHRFIPPGESCGPVMDQDIDNINAQQRGQNNPFARGFTLSNLEARITHMHDVLDSYLGGTPGRLRSGEQS
jgi:phenylpropionate dioxygenase-like ring-hydroxylating dioxygenase large terminal subunit